MFAVCQLELPIECFSVSLDFDQTHNHSPIIFVPKTMASSQLKCLFHFISFSVSSYAALSEYMLPFGHDGFLGKFRFLTFWNICFQSVYFGLCFLVDVTGAKSDKSFIKQWKDALHACVVFPATIFVFTSFWGLYAVDRELVLPKAMDAYFPAWLNHLVHTTILPFILIEKFVWAHRYPGRTKGFMGIILVASVYLSIIFMVAYIDNVWVYPVLQILNWFQRGLFIAVSLAVFSMLYLLGERMTDSIWGKELHPLKFENGQTKAFKKK